MRILAAVAFACVLPASLNAQGLSGPVSGFVHDSRTGTLRPINGLPGASTLGPSLNLRPLRAAAVRSDLDLAAGIDSESGAISVVRSLSRQPSERQYEGWLAEATGLAFDAAGKRLFAWSKNRSQMIVVSDLTAEPAVSASMDTSGIGDVVCAGANDNMLLVATASDSGARLFAIPIQSGSLGEPLPAGVFQSVSDIWLSDSDTAFIADREADSVFVMTSLQGSRDVSALVSARDGVSKPVSLYLHRDRLAIANAGDSTALIVNTQTRDLTNVPLASKPTRCQRLGADGLVAMNEAGVHPVTMLDLAEGASYFIPADLP